MEFFRFRKDIPFMQHALLLNIISLVLFFAAVFFLWQRGLHLSVEFTGGTVMEISYPQTAPIDTIRNDIFKLGYTDTQIQNFGSSRDVLIRLPLQKDATGKVVSSAIQSSAVMEALQSNTTGAKLQRVEYVGPQVGRELALDGLKALIFVVIGIVIYLSFRFEWKFAVAGIIANLHDIIIILGFFAFFQWEFSLSVLAAVLAVLGSTQMMVLAMLLLGGPSLFYFALALTIGIMFGIYSSVFVAAALAMWLGVKREDLVKGERKPEDISKDDPNYGAKV